MKAACVDDLSHSLSRMAGVTHRLEIRDVVRPALGSRNNVIDYVRRCAALHAVGLLSEDSAA